MNFDKCYEFVRANEIEIEFDRDPFLRAALLDNEALFHLPLLSFVILMMSKGKRKPNRAEIARLVGECIERSFTGFKTSSQHLGWSANLRVRTVKALSFLEITRLISISAATQKIEATNAGKRLIKKALSNPTDLQFNLLLIEKNYRNICEEKKSIELI